MFNRLIITASLGLSLLAYTGCDQQAAEADRNRENFAQAMKLVEEATQGFKASENGEQLPASMVEYQNAKFDKALEQLKAITAQVDGPEKSSAQRLIGNIHARRAQTQARDASNAFATLQGESAGLINYITAVEQINEAIISRTRDGEPTLQDIRKAEGMIDEGKSRLTASVAELSLKREEVVSKVRKLQSEAQRAFAEAQSIEDKAFALDDPVQQQQAYTKSYAGKHQGEQIRHHAQMAQIDADLLTAQIVPLETELSLWGRMADQLDELTDRVKSSDSSAASDVSESKQMRLSAIDTAREQYQLLADQYQSQVVEPLQQAIRLSHEAIASLEDSASNSSSKKKDSVQFDLLSARVEQTQIMSVLHSSNETFIQMIDAMSKSPAVQSDAESFFEDQINGLTDLGKQYQEQAQHALQAAEDMTNDDAFGPDGQAMIAVLDQYRSQL